MAGRLFEEISVGDARLKHRIAMAPLTRFRALDDNTPNDISITYYEQRASVPGTLLITEATFISPQAGGYFNVPGLWNDTQVKAWKKITDAVHKKGSAIYVQLWALGRVANGKALAAGGHKLVSSSNIPVAPGAAAPNPLTKDEIKQYVKDYATAAANAVKAGFDGVELHGANGYLIDQFWQDTANQRTDEYGGSVENRARFGLEVVDACVKAIGSKKVAIRLSPFSTFQGMCMQDDLIMPQFKHIVSELRKRDLAYLHLIESRIDGDVNTARYHAVNKENDPLIQIWGPETPLILAGGMTREKALQITDEFYPRYNIIIAFGRHFISTPDLPYRIKQGIPLTKYDRSTFYLRKDTKGYIDQPFSSEWQASQSKL